MSDMYVIHVTAGKECCICERLLKEGLTAYVPSQVSLIRRGGMWIRETHNIFPGYVFLCLDEMQSETYYRVKKISGVIRFLGRPPSALPKNERERIEWLCNGGKKLVPSRISVSDTGEIRAIDGVLKGNEHLVVRYNRRQKKVVLETSICGKKHIIKLYVEEQ